MIGNPKNPPLRDKKWLKRVSEMDCVLTGSPSPSDPAHIRYGLGGGMGMKPDDNHVLPLRHKLHYIQHNMGEVNFWCSYLPKNPDLLMRCVKAYAEKLHRENST